MWIYVDNDNRVQGYNPNDMEGNTGWVYSEITPPENYADYLYINGEYTYSPLPAPEPIQPVPTQFDVFEAQLAYTAMMTGTLLEV